MSAKETNVKVNLTGTTLTLTIDISKSIGPTSTGKSLMVASVGKSIEVPTPDGLLTVSLNAYREPKPGAELHACNLRRVQRVQADAAKEAQDKAVAEAIAAMNAAQTPKA